MYRQGAGGLSGTGSLRAWSNDKLGKCLYMTDLETRQGACLRVSIAALYCGLAGGVILLWYFFRRRLHVVYWLGYWPQATMLVFMLALAGSFLLLTRVRIIRYCRFQRMRGDDDDKKMINTNTNMGRLRPMVLFSAALALAAVGFGLGTEIQVRSVEAELRQTEACSLSTNRRVHKMQETSDRLVKFEMACNERAATRTYMNECPGFDENFGESKQYVEYLLRLETQHDCTGFCKSTVPLYFEGRNHMLESDSNDSCAVAIANDVYAVSLLVALPSVVFGIFLCMLALSLYEYDYL